MIGATKRQKQKNQFLIAQWKESKESVKEDLETEFSTGNDNDLYHTKIIIFFCRGSVWDPATAFTVGVDEHWKCIPCCKDNSFTLPQCQDGTEDTEKMSKDEEDEDVDLIMS